ncbi:hypothetical protein GGF43_004118, partial [Coemansia sp. RSA 2618]
VRQALDQARLEPKPKRSDPPAQDRPAERQDSAAQKTPQQPTQTNEAQTNEAQTNEAQTSKAKTKAARQYESRVRQREQQREHMHMPQEYWPADAMLRMPKVFGKFAQPADAEVAKIVLIGAANAGKSTLVNCLTGAEVSIVSRRPQTTRTRIMASSTVGSKQLVFLDTPGIVTRAGLRRIERGTVTAPWLTLSEAGVAILLLDAFKITEKATFVEDGLFDHFSRNRTIPAFLVINKVDLITDMERLRLRVADYRARYRKIIGEPIYISAMHNSGIDSLKAQLLAQTRPGDWEVPAHVTSDMSELTRVEELIRAEWFERMDSYMPYVITQRNVGWEESNVLYSNKVRFKDQGPADTLFVSKSDESTHAVSEHASGKQARAIPKNATSTVEPHERPLMRQTLVIKQQLIVPSGGQAKILIGTDGEHIKAISSAAASKISKALGRHVRLHIQVVVEEDKRAAKAKSRI